MLIPMLILGAQFGGPSLRGPSLSQSSATLRRIAMCESGGNPTAVSPSGEYRGKYQLDRSTWRRLGGTGDPAAPEATQDRIAEKLYGLSGAFSWPICGRIAG